MTEASAQLCKNLPRAVRAQRSPVFPTLQMKETRQGMDQAPGMHIRVRLDDSSQLPAQPVFSHCFPVPYMDPKQTFPSLTFRAGPPGMNKIFCYLALPEKVLQSRKVSPKLTHALRQSNDASEPSS